MVSLKQERLRHLERIHAGIARMRQRGTKSGKPIGRGRIDPKVENADPRFIDIGQRRPQDRTRAESRERHGTARQGGDAVKELRDRAGGRWARARIICYNAYGLAVVYPMWQCQLNDAGDPADVGYHR